MAPLFKMAGLLSLSAAFVPEYAILSFVGPLVAVAAYATGYSSVAYRRRIDGA